MNPFTDEYFYTDYHHPVEGYEPTSAGAKNGLVVDGGGEYFATAADSSSYYYDSGYCGGYGPYDTATCDGGWSPPQEYPVAADGQPQYGSCGWTPPDDEHQFQLHPPLAPPPPLPLTLPAATVPTEFAADFGEDQRSTAQHPFPPECAVDHTVDRLFSSKILTTFT